MARNDFSTEHMSGKAKTIANGIVKWMTERYGEAPDGGGCKAFYTAQEWKARGEDYGRGSLFILCHDGGDLGPLCNMDYECYKAMDDFHQFLREKYNVYAEQCTSWYTAIYSL